MGQFPYSATNSIIDVERTINFSNQMEHIIAVKKPINETNTQIQNSDDFYDSYLQRKNTDTNNNLFAAIDNLILNGVKFSRTETIKQLNQKQY